VQYELNRYPEIRGWYMQQAWDNADIRQAHLSLQDLSLEDRMKAFMLMVRYMPQDIILFDGPRLSTVPYR
jgi:hypothetical protein